MNAGDDMKSWARGKLFWLAAFVVVFAVLSGGLRVVEFFGDGAAAFVLVVAAWRAFRP